MVKYAKSSPGGAAETSVCGNRTIATKQYSDNGRSKLTWTKDEQNFVLGAFYVLPWLSQFFGGVLSHKYGTKVVVGLSTVIGCVMSSLIPSLAYIDPKLVMVVRAIQGFIGSLAFPAGLYTIIGHWCPPHERGRFMTVFLGTSLGIAVGYPMFGYIAETIGWEWVFHVTSLIGIVWYILWLYLVYDSPHDHPRISDEEKRYIMSSLGKSTARQNKLPVPWVAILTSMPFWINIICQFGVIWGRFTTNIYVPTYFKAVHGVNAKENGLISGIPFLLKSVLSYLSGVITDFVLRREMMSKTGVRSWSTFISSVLAGAALIGVSYAECDSNMAIICMSLCVILNACFITGSSVAIVDMSPNFCSILQGICGTIGMISGFISPALVSLFSRFYKDDPLEQWKLVWLVTGAVYVIPGMIFVLFSDSELQPWNEVKEKPADEELIEKEKK